MTVGFSSRAFRPFLWSGFVAFFCALTMNTEAVADQTLSLAIDSEPRTIDPRYAVDANSQYIESLLHCSLVSFDQDGRTVADLAKSWAWVKPTVLEVTLTDGVTFADGSAVRPEDVKATYEFFKKEDVKTPSPRQGAFLRLKSIKIAGKHKVVFELDEADSSFVQNLVVGILPAALARGDMIVDGTKVKGCGPFILKAADMTGLTLERNAKYTVGGVSKVETVRIKVVKDETTRFAKLRVGEVDIVQNLISRDKLSSLAKTSPSLKILKRPGLNTTYLGFNMKDPVVGKVAVRRAINQAIDREKIIKYVLAGLAVPAKTLITPSDPYFAKDLEFAGYDLEAAMKTLDAAGFKDPDGKGPKPRFALTYKTTTDVTRIAIAKAVAADLKKIGIEVSVEPLEWGRFKADVEAGKVQMWSLSWVGFKDPDIYRYAFATESFPPNGGNRGWYSNSALDKLLSQAKLETAFEKRRTLYQDVQKIVAEELPYVFLWHEEIFAVMNKDVQDFEIYADGRYTSLQRAYKN